MFLTAVSVFITLACMSVLVAALMAGLRPVVITTGSMGDAAPEGSLIVAEPRAASDIDVGQILVMRRPDGAIVTHRIIEIRAGPSGTVAITQGDANPVPDAMPYTLRDEELVARWTAPGWGTVLATLRDPRLVVPLLAIAVVAIAFVALRRIWSGRSAHATSAAIAPPVPAPYRTLPPPTSPPAEPPTDTPADPPTDTHADPPTDTDVVPPPPPLVVDDGPANVRRVGRHVSVAIVALTALVAAGLVSSLYSSSEVVDSNSFDTATCFSARLASVQSGVTVHATNGAVSEPITAVDPARSFVLASVRSNSNEPADSAVRVALTSGTNVEVSRATDAGSPPAVTVDWSVVEYACGVSVQRGTVNGDGTDALDVTIASVDETSSFVLVSSQVPATDSDFGTEELFAGELVAPTTLRIRGASGTAFPAGQSFAWQVVSFDDADDAHVQTASTTLGVGVAADTITLTDPVDVDTTVLLASVTSAASGPDIGERMARVHLVDATSVAVERSIAGDAVDVHVQAIDLLDGTVVRHGTIDLASGSTTGSVTMPAVDTARSTAISTVAMPGAIAGGLTDHAADDVVGETSATFGVTAPDTVTVTRDASASNASFGWQVIEWTGPNWWDTAYGHRLRIDVDTTTTAAPDSYTVPVTLDHARLAADGLAQVDGDDLRVLRWDGSVWTELDRVLDDDSSWNANDTTLWFRTTDPIAVSSTDSYWLYLHNPSAGAAPDDPEQVYLLVEDFESGLGDFDDRTGGTGWYSADPWTRRIPLTVTAGTVASTLSDFPLLVSLTSADLAANAQADGSDIRFTASDGSTPLAHEIEEYDGGSGALTAWVRLPSLPSGSPTTVYLYYGAADAPDQQDVRSTWPDEVGAAWHLARDPAGTAPQLDDSSARDRDGISIGAMTSGDLVPGLIGPALDLDGSDDALAADLQPLAGAAELTISGWVRLDTFTTDARLFSKAPNTFSRQVDVAIRNDGAVRARLDLDSGEVQTTTATATVTTGSWHHIAMVWDGANLEIVVDGSSGGSTPAVGAIESAPTMPVHLGNVATQDRPLDGLLDEVRLETTARSLAWLDAAEDNQRDPGTFVTVGTTESGTWFDQGAWTARKPVVVDADQVPADLFDFPLLVEVTDAAVQASAQACACDLVFTGADGTTRLDHTIEAYDSGTGALTAWVRVPVISATADTELFLYYGNPTGIDQQDAPGVFGGETDLQILGSP